jgi:hypothetical protein
MLHTIASLSFYLTTAFAACYFPDGSLSPTDVSCDATASDSFCCFNQQACLSNKLCLVDVHPGGINEYARGTCTDQNWESSACPNFCLGTQSGSGNYVASCNVTGSDEYCCDLGCSCDAGQGDEVVSFTGTPYTMTVIDVVGITYSNPSATTAVVATSSSDASTSTISTAGSASSRSMGSLAPSENAQTASSASTPTATSASSAHSKSDTLVLGIGVGVGVGFGILALGAASFVWYRRRSKNNGRPSTDQQNGPAPQYFDYQSPMVSQNQSQHQQWKQPLAGSAIPPEKPRAELYNDSWKSHNRGMSEAVELPGQM